MKSAEERMEADGIKITPVLRYHLDHMKLAYMKEGARRAGNVIRSKYDQPCVGAESYKRAVLDEQTILSTAEQWTVHDLNETSHA